MSCFRPSLSLPSIRFTPCTPDYDFPPRLALKLSHPLLGSAPATPPHTPFTRAGLVPIRLYVSPMLTALPTVVHSNVRIRTIAEPPTASIVWVFG